MLLGGHRRCTGRALRSLPSPLSRRSPPPLLPERHPNYKVAETQGFMRRYEEAVEGVISNFPSYRQPGRIA